MKAYLAGEFMNRRLIFPQPDTIRKGYVSKDRWTRMKDLSTASDVSVVIPCYRCPDTLERAVASVAGQSLRPAEVVLVDDASGDGTRAVMASLVAGYSRGWVKTVHRSVNGGPSAARNAGWERAGRPYIAFLDADDTWHRDKIRIQFGYMRAHPTADLTGHRWSPFREGETTPPAGQEVRPIRPARLLFSNRLLIGTVMLKREIPVRFDPAQRYGEDYLFCLRALYNGYRGAFIDLPLLYLHKDPYGEGGLSARLWQMERGELDAYRRVYDEGHIPAALVPALALWSSVRFARRILVSLCRRGARRGDG